MEKIASIQRVNIKQCDTIMVRFSIFEHLKKKVSEQTRNTNWTAVVPKKLTSNINFMKFHQKDIK
jgi:hypothetical protein